MDIFINLETGAVGRDRSGGSASSFVFVQGDNRKVRIFFIGRQDGLPSATVVPLPEGYTQMVLVLRQSGELEDLPPLLAYQGTWTEVTETYNEGEDDEYSETWYEADLNLNTTEVGDFIGTDDEAEVQFSVELNNGASRRYTPAVSIDAVLKRDPYRDSSGTPTPAVPPYPEADQIAPITGTNYRFQLVSGVYHLQVKNRTATTWHSVWIEGAAGEEQLVLDEA